MFKSIVLAVSIPALFVAPFFGIWYARPSQAQSPPISFQAAPQTAIAGNVDVLLLMDLNIYNRTGQVVFNDYWFTPVSITPLGPVEWSAAPVGQQFPQGIIVVEHNILYATARAKYLHNGAFESGNGPYN